MTSRPMGGTGFVIGIVADTHGGLPDAAFDALSGADAILHAGDVGAGIVLDLLATIAPVTVVRGNNRYASEAQLPFVANVALGGIRVMVAHRAEDLAGELDPVRAGAQVAVTGHTHVPSIATRDGVLWVNPGSPTCPRRGSPPSVALVMVGAGDHVAARIVQV